MAASAPADGPTGLGDVTFGQLGEYDVSQSGRTIRVAGTLNEIEWPEFSSRESDRTGYYLTLLLSGDAGAYVGKTTPSNDWKAVPLAECADGWCVAVKPNAKSFTFQAFADGDDAAAKRGGTTYTVDLSGVSYATEGGE